MLASKVVLRSSAAAIGLRTPLAVRTVLPRLASRQFSSLRPSVRPQIPRPSRPLLPLAALRFSSTGAGSDNIIPPYILPDSDFPAFNTSVTPVFPTTEYVGFLKEVGLDYGTGPTSVLQYLLENVHVLTASPWWVSIMLSVMVIRAIQLPFYLRMSETTARMKECNPQVLPLSKKMSAAQVRGDQAGMVMAQQMIRTIYRKAGVNRLWIAFPITQIPIFYGFYKNLYGMAELKLPGFLSGGNWWFHDLTVADPYFLLPLVSSLGMGMQIALGGEAGTTMQTKRVKQGMIIVLPILSFTFVHAWPAALTLYFFTNSMWGLLQASLLRNAWVRDKLGLYPLHPAAALNPLAAGSALNIAGPPVKIADATAAAAAAAPKQIGAKGGFLDRVTGGSVKKDGSKKTIADRVLGENEDTARGGISQIWKDSNEKKRHEDHERVYKRRLAKEEAEQLERKRRAGFR